MKNTFIFCLAIVMMCATAHHVVAETTATKPNGDGSSANPYQIGNLANLRWLSENSSAQSKCFVQTADIDAGETSTWNSTIDHYDGFRPIENFTGTYNGKRHIISNLSINRPSKAYIGLFAYMSNNAKVDSLGMLNVNIAGKNEVGGLVGAIGGGVVTNCYVVGTVLATNDNAGGIAGNNKGGTISCCYASGTISGNNSVGGLVGSNNSKVNNCYASNTVFGSGANVGGLIGYNGFATVSNCYAVGSVSGGGIGVGGLMGYNISDGNVIKCYYNHQSTGQNDSINKGTPRTTIQMKQKSTFADWNFDDIWYIANGCNYPQLRYEYLDDRTDCNSAPTVTEKRVLEEDIGGYEALADSIITKDLEVAIDNIPLSANEEQVEKIVKSIIDKYDKGYAHLTPKQASQLDHKIVLLKTYSGTQIMVVGHTCDEGTTRVSLAIGALRANVVRDYLIQHGIASKRIQTKSVGSRRPIVPNTDEASRRKNRRVEIKLIEDTIPASIPAPILTSKEKGIVETVIDGYRNGTPVLTPEQKNKLNDKIVLLNKYPDMQILCIGHTCDKGNDKTNFVTGQSRAQEIKDYLIQHGISSERIKTENMGDKAPLVPNTNEANRRKNRRVEIKIISLGN
ncbi:hypothetical protein FACS189452_00740 [Bacteroidia bacterium]|nr:hypothetical protein FACS189452_00740 [Bacteroidia bacterium]